MDGSGHRPPKQRSASCLGNRAISGVRDGHRNRKSQKSLRFRCAKPSRENIAKMEEMALTLKGFPARAARMAKIWCHSKDLVGISAPKKKYLGPPPPPNSPQTPSQPPRPHPSWENPPPPLLGFSIKTDPPPPSLSTRTPLSPPTSRKKIKNIRNVHRERAGCHSSPKRHSK